MLNAETVTFPAQNRADLYDGSALNAEIVTVSARSRVHLYDGIRESVDINIEKVDSPVKMMYNTILVVILAVLAFESHCGGGFFMPEK